MRAIDADELKEQIKNGLGIKSFENLLPVEKYIVEKIDRMPTIQPEPNYEEYEWCTDCKEYDIERHCCPRWNRVIKNTVDELKSAQPEQCWIPVKERNPIEYDNPIEFMATLEDPSGERYVEFVEWDGYEWDDFYTDDNERGVWGHDKVIAWMEKPEPFNED